MLWNLSLLIFSPLTELITGIFARKFPKLHEIVISIIICSTTVLSISLPISSEIYSIDIDFFSFRFSCDIYSYFFGILVNLVWLLTNLYSYSYVSKNIHHNKVNQFFKYLSLTIFAVFGINYSADLKTLPFFQVLLTLFTSPLILQHENEQAVKANKLYLSTHLLSALIFFLPAVLLLYHYNGSTELSHHQTKINQSIIFNQDHLLISSLLFFLFIFGISKNCNLPFHRWIIETTVAPTPVSGLLHSVAAVKSGSITAIKVMVYVFGLDFVKELTANFFTGGWIFYLLGFSAIYAAYKALQTTNIKHRFAYSTISQLSYILTSILIGTPLAMTGAMLHIISHSLCKLSLFYIAGVFATVHGVYGTKESAAIAPNLKVLIFLLAFCGASIIGLPFLPGSFGKDYMIISEWQTHHYSSIIFLIAGSIINVLYIYPIVKAAFFHKNYEKKTLAPTPFTMRLAIMIAISLSLMISFYINDLVAFFNFYLD